MLLNANPQTAQAQAASPARRTGVRGDRSASESSGRVPCDRHLREGVRSSTRVQLLALLLAVTSSSPALAVSRRKQCQQACQGLITLCTSNALTRGFGDLANGCRKSVLKRCKRMGIAACAPMCGDGAVNGAEACDASDLGGAPCQSRGLGPGTLACGPDCTFDTRGCQSCGNGRKA